MSEWITVAHENQFLTENKLAVELEHKHLIIVKQENSYYALENVCTHDGGPLADGWIEGEEIICPRHGARFSVKTGDVTAPPAYEAIATFRLRIQNGNIQVKYD